ncbi:MAG: hypothetical protein AB8G16_18150 [Gammaproteobacteria bacterium]
MTLSATTKFITTLTVLSYSLAANAQTPSLGEPILNRESVQISDHHIFGSDTMVDGATILIRDRASNQVNASIVSRALEPDTAYSIWWAIFNNPQFCIEPYQCGLADLGANGAPRVQPYVFWGGGFLTDIYGLGQADIRLSPGRTSREQFAGIQNYGLQNLSGAEFHLVLRTHGTMGAAGPVAKQIGTASEAGPSGGCSNVFASIHRP